MRKQLQALENETKLKDTKLHSTLVQLSQKETELERALGKISDLHTQITLLTADIHNSKVCYNLLNIVCHFIKLGTC